jgi:hypothetical protein
MARSERAWHLFMSVVTSILIGGLGIGIYWLALTVGLPLD